ncbi:MAG TPA: hypothetical protein VFG35_05835 [Actinoplanes sp.]|nr:hypothetical protein [Actinoplanes sp.]
MRARLLAFAISLVLGPGMTACSATDLKAAGEPCFASSECDVGLTCDFGSDPPVCRTQQTPPSGGPVPDAGSGMTPDAGPVVSPDAGGAPPDAGAPGPDAAPVPPDAAPVPPDASVPPDAATPPPDAAA